MFNRSLRILRCLGATGAIASTLFTAVPRAQTIPPARVAILLADERGAPTAADLATLRTGVRNADEETARAAIRALGRLGRPALVADILPALRLASPQLRAEAADALANAIGQTQATSPATAASPATPATPATPAGRGAAATGRGAAGRGAAPPPTNVSAVLVPLTSRLTVEDEPSVRAAICESIGRLPYADDALIQTAENTLIELAHSETVTERLGVMKGLESLIRRNAGRHTPGPRVVQTLRDVFSDTTSSSHDARVRRLALEALIAAGQVDVPLLERAFADSDPQVRRLAVQAASGATLQTPAANIAAMIAAGLRDPQALVRMEALRTESTRGKGLEPTCQDLVGAANDVNLPVALLAIDLLRDCGAYVDAVDLLVRTSNDLSDARLSRGWHRSAHALLALSAAAPAKAAAAVGQFTTSSQPYLRLYAARAAAGVGVVDDQMLDRLKSDPDAMVAAGAHAARDTTTATPITVAADPPPSSDINAEDLRRFASPRARIVIRDVGTIEIALFTAEAPRAVLRFARLATTGAYDARSIGAGSSILVNVVPPQANTVLEKPIREMNAWPHVRGTVGISPKAIAEPGGDAIFIDLVDNPQFDHEYPVIGQILNGLELLDQLLEGDVIERVEIIP